MAITTAFCNVAKLGFMRARNTIGDTYRMALYTDSASLNSATTRYLTANEISGTGYSAGGNALTGYASTLDSGSAILDFDDTNGPLPHSAREAH